MVVFKHTGDFGSTKKFLKEVRSKRYRDILEKYGKEGVSALASVTPVDTGKTAASWDYEIVETNGAVSIYWKNSNIYRGIPIALIIQYGHATKSGGYVQGRDYINPAIRPIFDRMSEELWKEVRK